LHKYLRDRKKWMCRVAGVNLAVRCGSVFGLRAERSGWRWPSG